MKRRCVMLAGALAVVLARSIGAQPVPDCPRPWEIGQRHLLGLWHAEFADHGWGEDVEVPDPNAESTFDDSKLDWDEHTQEPHATLLTVHRELIALRRAHLELSDPWLDEVEIDVDEEQRTVVLHRGRLRVAVNLGTEPAALTVGPIDAILLASEPVVGEEDALALPPEAFAIVRLV